MTTLSDLKDLLWFENISPHNEPLFPLLGFGMLSIKQLGILGAGIMLAWGIWQKTGDYLAIIPAVIVLILTFKKENVIPIEIKIIKIFLFYIGKHDKPLPKVRKNTIKSKSNSKLSIAKQYHIKSHARQNSIKNANVRNIPYIYDRMFRMKIRLTDTVEQTTINSRVRIVLDGILYGTARTDSNGEIMINFIPENPGKKLLQIYEDKAEPMYEEILNFIR